MSTKVWYEPGKDFYVVEFTDDSIFDLPDWAVGKKQAWGAISYHLFAALVDNKFLFHRLAIERQTGETLRENLRVDLTQLVSELRYMGRPPAEHNPTGFVFRPCIRAAEILESEYETLLKRMIAANPDIR